MEFDRNFAASTIRDIERNHGVMFDLPETSLARLKAERRPLGIIAKGKSYRDPNFLHLASRSTQIVIFPDPEQFYILESSDMRHASESLMRNILMIDEEEIIKHKWGIGGLKLVIGNVATHAGLVFACFDITGRKVRLHGKDYYYDSGSRRSPRYALTETIMYDSVPAKVGDFDRFGLSVVDFPPRVRDIVCAVRLGVPAQE